MNTITQKLADYGLAGLVIAALFYALFFLIREQRLLHETHAAERQLWLQAYKENTEVLRGLSSKCGVVKLN